MELISDLFGFTRAALRYKPSGKKATSERGELLGEIQKLTGLTLGYILHKTAQLKERDLHFIISRMNDDVKTGKKKSYTHAFNSCLFTQPLTHK